MEFSEFALIILTILLIAGVIALISRSSKTSLPASKTESLKPNVAPSIECEVEIEITSADSEIMPRKIVPVQSEPLENDSWEGLYLDGENPQDIQLTLNIDYTDGNRQQTNRIVDVRGYDPIYNNGMIIGYCELRSENRTFRLDRINKCIDTETGEIIQDLRSYLKEIYESSVEFTVTKFIENKLDLLKVLLFVAKADGQFRKEEKQVVKNYFLNVTGDKRIDLERVDKLFKNIDTPSLHGFKRAVGRLMKDELINQNDLYKCCIAIVNTQKTISAMEREALDYINSRLN